MQDSRDVQPVSAQASAETYAEDKLPLDVAQTKKSWTYLDFNDNSRHDPQSQSPINFLVRAKTEPNRRTVGGGELNDNERGIVVFGAGLGRGKGLGGAIVLLDNELDPVLW